MSKLNLNDYSDREIVTAFLNLSARKFVSVINAMSAITKRMESRGRTIASDDADAEVDNLIRRLFEGEQGPAE